MAKILHLINQNQNLKLNLVKDSINFYLLHLSQSNENAEDIIELKRVIREIDEFVPNRKN